MTMARWRGYDRVTLEAPKGLVCLLAFPAVLPKSSDVKYIVTTTRVGNVPISTVREGLGS